MVEDSAASQLQFVRISKSGSTSMKFMIREYARTLPAGRAFVFNSHKHTVPELLSRSANDQVVFFLRDPVARFVSGFNSRLREGRVNIPHSEAEKLTFSRFAAPNDLAEALGSADQVTQDRAMTAMASMMHTATHYSYWLRDIDYLERRIDRIAFLGFQETFDEDAQRLFRGLGMPQDELKVHTEHQAPPTASKDLSESAVANLRAWYADDYALYAWAKGQRSRWADGPTLLLPLAAEELQNTLSEAERRARRRARKAARAKPAKEQPEDEQPASTEPHAESASAD